MTRQGWPERWAKEIPDHRLHILPLVRHFPFEDAPEATVHNFRVWWAGMKPLGEPDHLGERDPTIVMR